MRAFLFKIFLLLSVNLFISLLVYIYFFYKPIDSDVEKSILIASKSHNFEIKKIRFGDSVSRQLYPTGVYDSLGEINITSNGAISILGQYLLLKKLVENNEDNISDSLIVEGHFRPTSLLNDLDESTTTNYFLKKFYNDQWFFNQKLLNENLANQIDSMYLNSYEKRWYIRKLYSLSYLSSLLRIPMTFNSEVVITKRSVLLFDLIEPELRSTFKDLRLHFCPISESKLNSELKSLSKLKSFDLESRKLKVLDDSCFVEDMIHLKTECVSISFK